MARIPQPEPPSVRDFVRAQELEVMRADERALFAEPDHAPELETQDAYEELRTNPWLGSDDEPPTAHRALEQRQEPAVGTVVGTGQAHRGRRDLCTWPAHQRWAVERFGRTRDDEHDDG